MGKSIIPSDSRYIPLTQQKFCCVPTCIQMVMLRHSIPLQPAELIGHHLGLIVNEDSSKYFWNVATGERPSSGYGTRISKPEYDPNVMFRRLNIPLKMTWSLIDKFETVNDFRKYLSESQKNNRDILVCYDWPTLFDNSLNDHWGHVCVFDRVYLEGDEIRIIDPSPNSAKWVTVIISDLYHAMQVHGRKNSGGFWELHYHDSHHGSNSEC